GDLGFETTEELEPLQSILGQDRALQALKFGLSIESEGFNVFVAGEAGTGRSTAVDEFVTQLAGTK
ncbi:MAG: AAA family ATPase, partial [Alicyclobacillus sp.]|nr:AAA family ATPase [Alicyclobacillus sp.]